MSTRADINRANLIKANKALAYKRQSEKLRATLPHQEYMTQSKIIYDQIYNTPAPVEPTNRVVKYIADSMSSTQSPQVNRIANIITTLTNTIPTEVDLKHIINLTVDVPQSDTSLVRSPFDPLTYKIDSAFLNLRLTIETVYRIGREIERDGLVRASDFLRAAGEATDYSMACMVEFKGETSQVENQILQGGIHQYFNTDNKRLVIHLPVQHDYLDNTYSPEKAERFINSVLRDYPQSKTFYFQLYKDYMSAQPFELFDSVNSNCVIEVLEATVRAAKDSAKQLHILETIKKSILQDGTGFTVKHAEEVYRKLAIKLRIYHNQGIWYNKESKKNCKTVMVYAHDNHASPYTPLKRITQVEYIEHNDEIEHCGLTPQKHCSTAIFGAPHIQTNAMTDEKYVGFTIRAYHQENKIYKTYRPPAPDDTNPDYYSSTTELAYRFKKWKTQNNLRAPAEPYFSLIKSASHLIGTQQFEQHDAKQHFHADINKAYPSYRTNKYYEQFKLPLGYYNFGKINDSPYNIVSKTGWSIIQDVQITHPLLQRMAYIQNNNIYTHVRLFQLLELGYATFTISATITSVGEDLEMPFNFDAQHKKFNNAFVGNLIASNKTSESYYTSNNRSELEQIKYDSSKRDGFITAYFINDQTLQVSFKNESKKQLYNIHTYIIDYAHTLMVAAMCANYDKQIISFHTDGFYTHHKTDIVSSQVHGQFKQEFKQINYTSTFTAPKHTAPELPEFIPTIQNNANNTLTIGVSGCGKSRQIFLNPYHDSNLCCPTHKLKNTHNAYMKLSPLVRKIMTYHKFFQIFTRTYKSKTYLVENAYIDECSMISQRCYDHIMNFARQFRINVHLVGDIDENGIHQLPPVNITGDEKELEFRMFTDDKTYEIVRAPNDYSQRRQGREDAIFLDSLRNRSYETVLQMLKSRVKIISEEQVSSIFDDNTTGIVATHQRGNKFNLLIYQRNKQTNGKLVLRSIKNKKEKGEIVMAKGDIIETTYSTIPVCQIYKDRQKATDISPAGTSYELGYFNTCDCVQGMTIDSKIIIDTTGANRKNFLYTAITRATNLDNVYLIC